MLLKLKKNLTPLRDRAYVYIDTAVENARMKVVTPGSGQAMAYQQKYEDALLFLSNPGIDPGEVPHVYAEVGITAPTAAEVAQVVVNLRSLWRNVSAQLEHLRLAGKKGVELAENEDDIDAAIAGVVASLG